MNTGRFLWLPLRCAEQRGHWQCHCRVTQALHKSCEPQSCTAAAGTVPLQTRQPQTWLCPSHKASAQFPPRGRCLPPLPSSPVSSIALSQRERSFFLKDPSQKFWDLTDTVLPLALKRAEGSSGATERVRKGLSDFLGVISDTFAPSPDKTIDCDVITLMATPSGTTEPYDSAKARLYSLQSDPATYCNEPDGPAELLEAWLAQFNLEEKKGEIAELLATSPSIRALYTKMVPVAVSHLEFWQRYFYKLHRLEQDEARREALKQRAEQSMHQEEPGWEEDEEEFLGMSPLPCANITFPGAAQKESAPAAPEGNHPAAPSGESWAVLPPELVPVEQSPSESSESVSLVTQIANPASVPATQLQTAAPPMGTEDLSQRLVEATLEEQSSLPKPPEAAQPSAPAEESAASLEPAAGTELRELESKGQGRTETLREEGPTDLRVFELNSDSGKSTPSNNGKKGSSTDISEDWEKDFDLDMTEEEVQLALSKVEMSGELEDEEWEDWE